MKNVITPEKRREMNNQYIKDHGIACYESLPTLEPSSAVKLKDIDIICKRSIACLISIQLACDIDGKRDYNESKEFFSSLLKMYDVERELLEKEKRLFDGSYTSQDAIDVSWTYEAYWSLLWVLGLIDDIKDSSDICNCEKAITAVSDCKNYDEFKNKCKLRNIEEILDMLDLYFRYHWACVEKRINPSTNIGNLNPDVVVERRKGLEWVISSINEWDEIALDT